MMTPHDITLGGVLLALVLVFGWSLFLIAMVRGLVGLIARALEALR